MSWDAAERMLTAKQVADRLGVHPKTVREWARERKIPAFVTPGGEMRFRPALVEKWIEKNTTKAKDHAA